MTGEVIIQVVSIGPHTEKWGVCGCEGWRVDVECMGVGWRVDVERVGISCC